MIAMAHKLRIKVVAEGAETAAQIRFLKARRCDAAQGYLFGAPMAEDMLAMLFRESAPPWAALLSAK